MPDANENNIDQIVFTRQEAARLAKVGLNSLDELIKQGSFPALRIGRRVLIPAKPFVTFLDGR